MKQQVLELMKQYNGMIVRYNNANKWMESNIDTVDTQIENYRKLVKEIDGLGKQIKALGYEMDGEEILEGFKQIKYLEGAI